MPSIGSANTSTAFGDCTPAVSSRLEIATAIEKPGALPATPMMINLKNERESAFSSVLIDSRGLLLRGSQIEVVFHRDDIPEERRALPALQFTKQVEKPARHIAGE